MITCDTCRVLIEQYIEGVIADEQLDELKAHAETCDACATSKKACDSKCNKKDTKNDNSHSHIIIHNDDSPTDDCSPISVSFSPGRSLSQRRSVCQIKMMTAKFKTCVFEVLGVLYFAFERSPKTANLAQLPRN